MTLTTKLLLIVLLFCSVAIALEPKEIIIIVNSDIPESVEVGNYYAQRRQVPLSNILTLRLGSELLSDISRDDYLKSTLSPVKQYLAMADTDDQIKCIVTTYGVPYRIKNISSKKINAATTEKLKKENAIAISKVGGIFSQISSINPNYKGASKKAPSNPIKLISQTDVKFKSELARISKMPNNSKRKNQSRIFSRLYKEFYGYKRWISIVPHLGDVEVGSGYSKIVPHEVKLRQAASEKWNLSTKLSAKYFESIEVVVGLAKSLQLLNSQISMLSGKETGCALDSELSMLKFDDYELYRWQPNELKRRLFWIGAKTLMVSRLDGPTAKIAKGLVDKSISAEEKGLSGMAYFDMRGYAGNKTKGEYEKFDSSLARAAKGFEQAGWGVRSENTEKLFSSGQCPDTGAYCGWYSLKKYIPSFTFVDGAIGYHIASWEAVDLRSVSSKQWVPNLLNSGITATLGAVAEPYLSAFPMPDEFFAKLRSGKQLGEAYYRTKPFNSWQMLLIGDPLYRPFPRKR